MNRIYLAVFLLFLFKLDAYAQETEKQHSKVKGQVEHRIISAPDAIRVRAIAAMLPENPKGFGPTITDRDAWNALLKSGKFDQVISTANQQLTEPFPVLSDEVYLAFFTKNDSESSKAIIRKRILTFASFVWAECLLNNGKYLKAIENSLEQLIKQKSWNFPREDPNKVNFEGKRYTVNLGSAAYAHDIAQGMYMLGDKLNPQIRFRIKEALYSRVFNPTKEALKTGGINSEFVSLLSTGNHNSVTLSGVTGAALASIQNRMERAFFVAIAERYSRNSLDGFLDDGYCTEGLTYYNYGFGHYILLRENIWQATQGKIDLFNHPKIAKIARYVPGIEIINNIFPLIGDCSPTEKPSAALMFYINRNVGLGLKQYDNYLVEDTSNRPLTYAMYVFPNSATAQNSNPLKADLSSLRSYFEQAAVLTVRPVKNSAFNMGATFKGGNNNEHHNHNDIGSLSIVVGNEMLMGDPGLAVYTSKTFGPERYTFKTIGSYGHPVPLVAGAQQRTGPKAQAKIISKTFTPLEDRIVMDITSGYDVAALKKLHRSFTYNRGQEGYIEMKDEVVFSTPQSYETALITRAKWKQVSENTIELQGASEKLRAVIKVPGSGFSISSEEITDAPQPYTRIGIRLKDPLKTGSISIVFTPVKTDYPSNTNKVN